jgi:tripartite-type tricarboxylate transporter receptor subunit TctC
LTAGKDRRWEDTMLAKLLAGALLLWLCGAASSQQKWPSRNIEIIIPLSPDSGVDLIGRAVATA